MEPTKEQQVLEMFNVHLPGLEPRLTEVMFEIPWSFKRVSNLITFLVSRSFLICASILRWSFFKVSLSTVLTEDQLCPY